jgi:hypothetical protein
MKIDWRNVTLYCLYIAAVVGILAVTKVAL